MVRNAAFVSCSIDLVDPWTRGSEVCSLKRIDQVLHKMNGCVTHSWSRLYRWAAALVPEFSGLKYLSLFPQLQQQQQNAASKAVETA